VSISYPPVANQIASGVNAGTVPVTTASTEIVAANPLRAGGSLLINNTNKVLWIRLNTSTNAAAINGTSSFAIPASGGNYRLPDQYQGAIQGLLAANATGTVQFIEPIF
jgi:hypothetical protein